MIKFAALGGAILLALLVFSNWQRVRAEKSLRRAETALELANAQVAAEQQARENDARIAAELASMRTEMSDSFKAFDETLKTSKVTREVRYVTQTGETVSCQQRDPAVFRSLFNEALSTPPDSR